MIKSPKLSDYLYELPDERIARYPVSPRHSSKLLVYRSGAIHHHTFTDLPGQLPQGGLLAFNNSKVIPARIIFTKSTGAHIEVFLTEPFEPALVPLAMEAKESCVFTCMIGNKKRWKEGDLELPLPDGSTLTASLQDRENNHVRFSWNNGLSFSEVVELCGRIPLPPYLNRAAEDQDTDTYQTVYSKEKGAVAAPTAGLHFTAEVLHDVKEAGTDTCFLTLHVSAGTFKPVSVEDVLEHDMHAEQMVLTQDNLALLLKHIGQITAVGTTSMRVLESLYWFGVRLLNGEDDPFFVPKLYPYEHNEAELPSSEKAIKAVQQYMTEQGLEKLHAATQIFIVPGYTFRMCRALVTNYHQPGSTLMLLVAAFIVEDWKKVYQEALDNNYRFLSYGDSSLLMP